MKRLFYIFSVLMASAALLSSCIEELEQLDPCIGEGTATLSASVQFSPFAGSRLATKSSGNAVKNINSLWVVVYNAEGTSLLRAEDIGLESNPLLITSFTPSNNTDVPVDYLPEVNVFDEYQAEEVTQRVSFDLTIRSGRYRIYAVANMPNLVSDHLSQIQNVAGLKAVQAEWSVDNVTANAQMIGAFAKKEPTDQKFSAEEVIDLPPNQVTVHAWLKRLASKVTVSFDASKLDESTRIFIRRVMIKNIPGSCYLWNKNAPGVDGQSANDIIPEGESIWFTDNHGTSSAPREEWMQVYRREMQFGSDHSETSEALYFYENMQGLGPDKRQDADDDGDLDKPNGGIRPGNDGFDPDQWRDGKSNGTFIEVEAYYVSSSRGNETEGDITYRFMLGKNISTNYDCERNHHYKVTMSFEGYANNVDWHVEYEKEPGEAAYVIEPIYISYMYGEQMMLPVIFPGLLAQNSIVTAEIVRNDWFPYGAVPGVDFYDGDLQSGTGSTLKTYKFKTAGSDTSWEGEQYYENGQWMGFLTLCNTNLDREFIGHIISPANEASGTAHTVFSGNETKSAYLADYWNGSTQHNTNDKIYKVESQYVPPQGKRQYYTSQTNATYKLDANGDTSVGATGSSWLNGSQRTDGTNGEYEYVITTNGGKTKTHMYLPLYTRAHMMIKTLSYTGSNPYHTYQRKAVVRITYKLEGSSDYEHLDIPIMQVRRILNPSGVYREAGNNKPFHVTLCHRMGERSTEFVSFNSEGQWTAEIESGSPDFIDLDGKNMIAGATGSPVDFTINFHPTASTANRYAVILVKYHNFTCSHRIFVRQGYKPEALLNGGAKWHCFNLRGGNYETESPIGAGSLFRMNNLDDAIDDSEQFGADVDMPVASTRKFQLVNRTTGALGGKKTWDAISYNTTATNFAANISVNNPNHESASNAHIARASDFALIRNDPNAKYAYGICYDDGADRTMMDGVAAVDYYYDGAHVGHGMRGIFMYNENDGRNVFLPAGRTAHGRRQKDGILRYAGPAAYIGAANRPLLWDLKLNYGVVYWTYYDTSYRFLDLWDNVTGNNNRTMGWDINLTSYDFDTFWQNGNAGANYIRLVE